MALQNQGGCLASCRFGMEVPTSKSHDKEVTCMTDFELISTFIGILGLLIALYAAMKGKK